MTRTGSAGYRLDTRREAYGAERRAILTHSPELHACPGRRVHRHHLAKAGRKLDGLAATLARGKTRRSKEKVHRRVEKITAKPLGQAASSPGSWPALSPKDLRLTWHIDLQARAELEEEIFGKHVLITSHDDWTVPDVVAGYRSQSEAEFSFRQMKDTPRRVLQPDAPLDRAQHPRARLHLRPGPPARPPHAPAGPPRRPAACPSANCSDELGGIGETILLYHGDRGRPRAHRMLTETTPVQDKLTATFGLARYAPRR